MTARRSSRRPADHPDLFDWVAMGGDPAPCFAPAETQAATLQGRIAKGVRAALAGRDRNSIAKAMSDYLGERVSLAMLNQYASEAAAEKQIPVTRLMALIHASEDKRLLNLIAEHFGMLVVDKRCAAWIKAGQLAARMREISAEANATEQELALAFRLAKRGGR